MRRNRYGGYRGRSSAGNWLRRIAIVLGVLVVLAGGGLLAGQRYIIYTDNGLRLDLPFSWQNPSEDELNDITVVVEPEEPAQSQPEEPPVEQTELPLRAIVLGMDHLLQGTALEQIQAAGANAVVLDMKQDNGRLGYASSNGLAAEIGANSAAEAVNQAIQTLAQEDIRLIARVSCFRDHRLAERKDYAIETNPGRRWCDLDGVRWSNPAKPAVREYLVGIMKELAALGFDEILLDHWGYPSRKEGHLEYIKKGEFYDPEQVETVIAGVLDQLQTALEGSQTKLSLYCRDGVLQGFPDKTGRTLEQLKGISGRVWLENPQAAAQFLQQAGVEHPQVKIVSDFIQEDTEHQAVLHTER